MNYTETDKQMVTITFWMIVALMMVTAFLPKSLEDMTVGACLIPLVYNVFHGFINPTMNMEE